MRKDIPRTTLEEILAKAEPVPKPKGRRAVRRYLGSGIGIIFVSIILGILMAIMSMLFLSPTVYVAAPAVETWRNLPEDLPDVAIAERSYFYDKNGDVFATIWDENRIVLDSLDQVSKNLVNALVATEDQRFYTHGGIDFLATGRSLITRSGGGSGITQQLIKNLRFFNLNNEEGEKDAAVEHSLARKLGEAKLAINYDKSHSKDEILLEYLNTVAVGSPTIYGVETASQYFFGVPASELSIAQAAALVGSINNPGYFNLDDPENTEWPKRQELVITRLLDEGMITPEEAEEARSEELNFVYKRLPGGCSDSKFPFYCDQVLKELKNSPRLGESEEQREAAVFRGGLHVNTYLDPTATNEANNFLSSTLGDDNRVVAPTAVVEPGTGGVLVMAQNRAWGDGPGQTHIVLPEVPAGTGSTFKMVTLAAAAESGIDLDNLRITPRCPLTDSSIDTPPGGIKNTGYCDNPPRAMDYKEATAVSSNVWFVELALRVGIMDVVEMADKLGLNNTPGITSRSGSFPLGVTENSPVDMAAAYATFVNEGVYCPAKLISSITYENGDPVPIPDEYDPAVEACQRVISPRTASQILSAMKEVISGNYAGATGANFAIPNYDTVAKSGTNNLMNTTWVQLSKQYSLFTNVYDMDSPLDGIETIWYKNDWWSWRDHPSADIGKNILAGMLSREKNQPLNYSSNDGELAPVPVERRDFTTVPSVIGMEPSVAVAILDNLGFIVKVEKERVKVSDSEFPPGVVAVQSLEAGSKIPKGAEREITLTLNQ